MLDEKYKESKQGSVNIGYGEVVRLKGTVFIGLEALDLLHRDFIFNKLEMRKDVWLCLIQLYNVNTKKLKLLLKKNKKKNTHLIKLLKCKSIYLERYIKLIFRYQRKLSKDPASFDFYVQIEKMILLQKIKLKLLKKQTEITDSKGLSDYGELLEIKRLIEFIEQRESANDLIINLMIEKNNYSLPEFVKLGAKSPRIVSEEFHKFVTVRFSRYLQRHTLKRIEDVRFKQKIEEKNDDIKSQAEAKNKQIHQKNQLYRFFGLIKRFFIAVWDRITFKSRRRKRKDSMSKFKPPLIVSNDEKDSSEDEKIAEVKIEDSSSTPVSAIFRENRQKLKAEDCCLTPRFRCI